MKQSIKYILVALFLGVLPLTVVAKDFYGYTEENPLIVACDWDFRPFEFLDSEGQPAGYNVEVLDIILNRLEIPHKFVMQEWQAASDMFVKHEADLLHALSIYYKERPFLQTKKYVNYYNLRAVRRVDTPPFSSIDNTSKGVKVGVKKNDYAALRISEIDTIPFTVQYLSPKDGLVRVRSRQSDYYIWGQIPLEKKIQELGIDSLVLDDVKDIPAGELHIIGYEMDVLDAIDDQYTRLEQSGDLQRIYDKWFHPERVHDNASPLAPFILIGLVVAGIALFIAGRIIYQRVNDSIRRNTELNSIMAQALDMDDYIVLEYDIVLGIVKNVYGTLLPVSGIPIEELIERVAPEERDEFRMYVNCMKRGDCESWNLQRRYNTGTSDKPCWKTFVGGAVLERENGVPRYILHTVKDITKDLEEEQRDEELANKYLKVFETNMMAMSFHDADGFLINMNQRMRELLEITPEREQHFRETSFLEDPFLKGYVSQSHFDTFHVCGRMFYPN